MLTYDNRCFAQREAAQLTGVPYGSIRKLIHRSRDIAVLYCEKRKGRRWFSVRDAAILRIGLELERAGQTWLAAIGHAYNAVATRPAPDAVLVTPSRAYKGSGGQRIVSDRDVARLQVDHGLVLIPIGKIITEIENSAAAAFERPAE